MAKLRRLEGGRVVFLCPGCGERHALPVEGSGSVWQWNGSLDSPTFKPSILDRSGHYVPGYESSTCWCTYNREHEDKPAPFKCHVCHSFVTDGKIQFLPDSTHALAGQTVPIPEWEV
jgi:hypothetical protein